MDELKRSFEQIGASEGNLLQECKGDVPAWVKNISPPDSRELLDSVLKHLDKVSEEVAEERERVGTSASTSSSSARGEKLALAYISALRKWHVRCGRHYDAVLKRLDPSAADQSTIVSSSSSSMKLPTVALGKSVEKDKDSATSPQQDLQQSQGPPPKIPSRVGAPSRAAPPPPVGSPPPSSSSPVPKDDDDPFAEEPVPSSRTRTIAVRPGDESPRKMTVPAGLPTPVPQVPMSAVEPVAVSAKETSPRRDREEESQIIPNLTRNPTPSISLSPRGRGGGRKGLDLGASRRGGGASSNNFAESPAQTSFAAAGAANSTAPLEWGSLERPLKQLSDSVCSKDDITVPMTFEVQRKALLGWMSFSLTLTDTDIAIYDVKQQTSTVRALSSVLKVTRSNKSPKKLKIWWRGEACDRYVFASPLQREIFVEGIWTLRKAVPQPRLYSEPIEIYIGTWNLGEAMPPTNVQPWLHPGEYDMYVVTAQEAGYDLDKGQSGNAEQHFFSLIEGNLGIEYVRVAQLSLLHIRMCVYVARRHAHKVSNVRKASVATGIGGVVGNKGGCFVSLQFNETTFCFVGCHLAAREERYEQRCQNFQQILSGISAAQPAGLGADTWFDYLFWTGDLNYRLTADRSQVVRWANECNVEALLESDQLMLAKRENKAFYLWTEPEIKFSPSYRFDRGSMAFSEEKMRTPSYCDRVLYRCKANTSPTVTNYDCCHELQTSDHHPVWASFEVDTLLTGVLHKRKPCYIEISDLQGKELPFVAPDREAPFVMFYSTFTKPGKQTKRASARGANPRWDDAGMPKMKPFFSDEAHLALSHISMAVRDGKNEVGQGVLSLKEAVASKGTAVEFVVPLVKDGLPAGELRGKICISWPEATKSEQASGEGSNPKLTAGISKKAPAVPAGIVVLKKGYLLKQGSKVKSWKRRWFVFTSNGELAYYADTKATKPLDTLHVDRVSPFDGAGKTNCMAVDSDKRRLLFCADNKADYDSWMEILQKTSE